MSDLSWRSCLLCFLFSYAFMFLDIRTDAVAQGTLIGYETLPKDHGRSNQTLGTLLHEVLQSKRNAGQPSVLNVSVAEPGALSRQKRNVLFSSGVKLCAQETVPQAIANHLSYFHLRVCQETVWEAFKIFWDRLPEQEEYQGWMSRCQDGTVTALDIGNAFSQSKEHLTLVQSRVPPTASKSEPTKSWQHVCSTPTPAAPVPPASPEEGKALGSNPGENAGNPDGNPERPELTIASPLENDISVELERSGPPVVEQVVKLRILLTGESYSEELKDPASLKYQILHHQFTEKIEGALVRLPGFKSVAVLDFGLQKDAHGRDCVEVYYAVTVEGDEAGVSSQQLDYLTLQSNRVETSYLEEVEERPTVVYGPRDSATDPLHPEGVGDVSETRETESVDGSLSPDPAGLPDDPPDNEDMVKGLAAEGPPGAPDLEEENNNGGRHVVVLEERRPLPEGPRLDEGGTEPAGAPAAPVPDGVELEGLLLENTAATPAPAVDDSSADVQQPGGVTLPQPPLEEVVSGSGEGELEESGTHTGLATLDEDLDLPVAEDKTSDDEEEEEEELEFSTITTVTVEEFEELVLPTFVPPHVVVLPRPNPSRIAVSDPNVTPAVEEPPPEVPEEEKQAGQEVGDEKQEELPVEEVIVEAPDSDASEQDLSERDMLLVNETPLDDSTHPTLLSPERDSPFTRVSDITPDDPVTLTVPTEANRPADQADMEISIILEVQTSEMGLADTPEDPVHRGETSHTEEDSSGFSLGVVPSTDQAIALPVNPGRALMVFFSLRVTNMMFSDDLFNKSSPEYKALEQRFLELLVPYLQSNLSNFQNLEILNFRNGSIVVNSRMKFGKPVARGVTNSVYLILENFCNTAYQTMNLAIDKYSLDVESGDLADPCKFQACNEFAQCKVNRWSGEAECVCNSGYFSVDGLPCQSLCDLQKDFCLNDGKCDIIPGQGAICRCRVGENWWYRGEHCEEYVSEPLVVGIAIASVAGFLLVASGVIFFLARTLRDQYDKDESEDPIRMAESIPSLERATKYNPMYESDATTGYSHYYRRYPEAPVYSSASAEASTDFSSEEIRHIYENSELTKEEIQDRIRIIELYAKDRQFADFVRQHQVALDSRRESTST